MNTFKITKNRDGWWTIWRGNEFIAETLTWQGAVNYLIRMGWLP